MSSDPARLACTVRGCGLPLTRDARRVACAAGHSYDVARRGYLNLLQPQDRKSLAAGDPKEIVAARSRLFAAGVGRRLVDAIAVRAAPASRDGGQIVDLGCGSGDALAAIVSAAPGSAGVGIDLSVAAIDLAVRRHPALTWVVANADRQLPLPDASTHLLLSIHARRSPDESARVLAPEGRLLVAVPAAEDLIELRAAVQGEAVAADRVEGLLAAHAARFTVLDRAAITERHRLEGDLLRDLLRVTYRGQRRSEAPRAGALESMEVTLASELVVFESRRPVN